MVRTRKKVLEESNHENTDSTNTAGQKTRNRRLQKENEENTVPNPKRPPKEGGSKRNNATCIGKLTQDNLKSLELNVEPTVADVETITLSDCSDATVKDLPKSRKFFKTHHNPEDKAIFIKKGAPKVEIKSRKALIKETNENEKGKDKIDSKKVNKRRKTEARRKASDDDVYSFIAPQESEKSDEENSYIQGLIAKFKAEKKRPAARRKPKKKVKENIEELENLVQDVQTNKKPVELPNKMNQVMEKIRANLKQKVSKLVEKSGDESPSLQKNKKLQNKKIIQVVESAKLEKNKTPKIIESNTLESPARDYGFDVSEVAQTPPRITPKIQKPNIARGLSHPKTTVTTSTPVGKPLTPWRINDEIRIPHTKYFRFSSDQLPSYSSDNIVVQENRISTMNHSNGENLPPSQITSTPIPSTSKQRVPLRSLERATIMSPLVQHSKPAKQAIEVLENVPIQTRYKVINNRLVLDKSFEESFHGFEGTSDASNCFGFEPTSVSEEDDVSIKPVNVSDLKEKLVNLRHVEVQRLGQNVGNDSGDVPHLFLSPFKKQNKDLAEMFKENPTTKVIDSSDSDEETFETRPRETTVTAEIHLFDDPETLFVPENIPRKSYARPARNRKPKVQFSDYDDTESDEEPIRAKKKRKAADHNVENTEEFKTFVSEFNSMCEEVEQYEIPVEKIH